MSLYRNDFSPLFGIDLMKRAADCSVGVRFQTKVYSNMLTLCAYIYMYLCIAVLGCLVEEAGSLNGSIASSSDRPSTAPGS